MESINESISFYNIIEKHKNDLNSGSGKLCLSPFLLSHINEALNNLKNDGRSTPVEIPYELKIILYDLESILKSVSKLKLIQRNVATFSGPCDLKWCSSLKDAEFFNISLDNVLGLDAGSNEIICLLCCRCVNVFDIFTVGMWDNLKVLKISYCQLSKIESEYLSNIRNIEYLNLSFNNLKKIDGLEVLTKLKSLDISFNYFEEIPHFNEEPNCLTNLYCSHNNITSLKGIAKLVNLSILDASDNCIYEKELLVDLYLLKYLKILRLCNNPISLRKHYRMYVSHFLGTIEPPFQFLLDDVRLSDSELDFLGSSRGVTPMNHRPCQPSSPSTIQEDYTSSEVIQQTKGILKNSNRKARKGREVIIVDATADLAKTPAVRKPKKTGVTVHENATLESDPIGNNENVNLNEESLNVKPQTPDEKPTDFESNYGININQNEVAIQNQLMKRNDFAHERIVQSFQQDIHSSPESTQAESQTVEVTVHAIQDDSCMLSSTSDSIPGTIQTSDSNLENMFNNEAIIDISDIRILESIDLILQNDVKQASNTDSTDEYLDATSNGNDDTMNATFKSADSFNNNSSGNNEEPATEPSNVLNTTKEDNLSSDDSAYDDELTGDEHLWPVQKIVVNSKPVNLFLVLLDVELRERSTISGRTIASYPLAFVQSCTQISDDPITVEVVFSSLLKHTIVRTYIMEFADAQTLMNKMNLFLASRPDIVDDELTSFLCKSCNAFFSVYKTQARTLCTICGSALVKEMKVTKSSTIDEHLSHSSSQSSVVSSSLGVMETKNSLNNNTNPSSVSTVSSEPSDKSAANLISTPQKYESDVEIISNPSQSSIEVLDDRGTPSRKRSSEERHVIIPPTLSTLVEVTNTNLSTISEALKVTSNDEDNPDESNSQLVDEGCEALESAEQDQTSISQKEPLNIQLMTESSSSGSVMTSYEASGPVSNATCSVSNVQSSSVIEEVDGADLADGNNDMLTNKTSTDIYSYSNFTDVDHRIKAFLYQYIFNDDAEELTLFARCHLWKTGGTDYPACFVLSNKKVYILMHTSSEYGLDASDWLKLQESHDLKSLKKLYPLIWHLGVGVQINRLNYFVFLFNKTYTDNLLSCLKGLSIKGCDFGSKPSSKVELSLQQVVLTSNYVRDVIDPTILLYTICLKINVLKDDEMQETMTFGGFVMTANEFYIVLGDFGWMASSGELPTIHFCQMMSNLIEIDKKDNIVNLHFLDEADAVEVVWRLHCSNSGQLSTIIEAMKVPWETVFSVPLQVACK